MTFEEIADKIRSIYPTAVSVTFFVNAHEMEMTVKHYDGKDTYSMRQLNGEFVKRGDTQ